MWPHLFTLYASQIFKTIQANVIVRVTKIACFPFSLVLCYLSLYWKLQPHTWPHSRFPFWLICNFNESVRLQIVLISPKKQKEKQPKNFPKWKLLVKIDNQTFNLFLKWRSSINSTKWCDVHFSLFLSYCCSTTVKQNMIPSLGTTNFHHFNCWVLLRSYSFDLPLQKG